MGIQLRFGITVGEFLSRSYWIVLRKSIRVQNRLEAFKKSVGLNGVGIKAVNALSTSFDIQSFREGDTRRIEYFVETHSQSTRLTRRPTKKMAHSFPSFRWFDVQEISLQERVCRAHVVLLHLLEQRFSDSYNGKKFRSKDGLKDFGRKSFRRPALSNRSPRGMISR